ncbi:hypothetical protein KJ365_02560 [Glaciecola sp. XM2]|uniref:hypothetical protein n=1 Tax=Glaciecola sp. XM2 TaxID=1914931 RepID=UPI001BDDF016|nr:hypothetical protein [Glaciecola sp. XM2]MBT1449747.1 hypothetical protein [Glaciecola sp. XM2]
MMYTVNHHKKRLFLTSAFCIFIIACTPNEGDQVDEQPSTASEAVNIIEPQPLLSLSELLSAEDVKNALADASANGDTVALKDWQSRLLVAADEVDLLASERKLIKGEQGLVFLEFQGMKTNYQRDFEQAFFAFSDVDAVYAKYPAFENMHQASRDLVEKRDTLISSIANELKSAGLDEQTAVANAKQQWQQVMQSQ